MPEACVKKLWLKTCVHLPCLALPCLGLAWLGSASLGLAWLGLAWLPLHWLGLAWLIVAWFVAWLGLAWLGVAWLVGLRACLLDLLARSLFVLFSIVFSLLVAVKPCPSASRQKLTSAPPIMGDWSAEAWTANRRRCETLRLNMITALTANAGAHSMRTLWAPPKPISFQMVLCFFINGPGIAGKLGWCTLQGVQSLHLGIQSRPCRLTSNVDEGVALLMEEREDRTFRRQLWSPLLPVGWVLMEISYVLI